MINREFTDMYLMASVNDVWKIEFYFILNIFNSSLFIFISYIL